MAAGYKLLGKGVLPLYLRKCCERIVQLFLNSFFFFSTIPSLLCVQSRRWVIHCPLRVSSILQLQLLRGCMYSSCFAVARLVLLKEGSKEKPGGFSRRLSLVSPLLSLEQFSLCDTACMSHCSDFTSFPSSFGELLISLSVHFRIEILHSSVLAVRH